MKAQILKQTGLTEKQFYAKYKNPEDFENSKEGKAFFKAHPEARSIKTAQMGADVNKNGIPDLMENYQPIDNTYTGQGSIGRQFGSGIGNTNFGPQNNPNPIRNTLPRAPIAQEEIYNPATQSGIQAYVPSMQDNIMQGQAITNAPAQEVAPLASSSFASKAAPYVGAATSIIGGIQGLKAQKQEQKKIKQARKVTDIQKIASGTREEEAERRYVTPWDNPVQQEQMFPTYGVGTNALARNGVMLYSGGEIQNTYAPDNLYDDLGYEPLNDSNVKQYYHGGGIPRAQDGGGFMDFMGSQGGTQALGLVDRMTNNNSAEAQIGSGIGEAAGTAFGGPVGGMIGKTLGGAVGGLFNKSQKAIKRDKQAIQRNQDTIMGNQFGQAFQNQYSSVVRNGGNVPNYEEGRWVSHDWQPQVIASFGGLNEQEVYDYAHDGMESLRAGGHIRGEYTPVSNRGMEQYAMGGEVKTTWGGHAETISHNPYMPVTGETIMFRGKSHDESDGNGNTGIGVKYGKGGHDSYTDYAEYGTQEADADVEVERGEPAAELQDANGEKNLTVYGNLKIPNQYLDILGDKNAKGKKFKNYVADLSKIEAKQNKIVETSTDKLNALNPQTQFDKLKLTSLQASIQGANMKLKDIADKKMNAAYLQNAINETAEENGLVADDLARGKVKFDKEATAEYAKYGKSIPQAKGGVVQSLKEGLAKEKAAEEKRKKDNAIKKVNLSDGVTRYIYSNGRAMDVDKNGKKKMITIGPDHKVAESVDKNGNITRVYGDGTKNTIFKNGRIAYEGPDGQRKMGSDDGKGGTIWDVGDLYDPKTGGGTTPAVYAALNAKKGKPAPATTPEPNTNQPPTSNRNTNVNTETPGTVKGRGDKWDYTKIGPQQTNPDWQTKDAYYKNWATKVDSALDDSERAKKILDYIKSYTGPNSVKVKAALAKFPTEKAQLDYLRKHAKDEDISDMHYLMDAGIQNTEGKKAEPAQAKKAEETKKEEDKVYPVDAQKRNPWIDAASQILPFFRPTDQEGLDPNQLMGEYYALSNNQLEPVQAQTYQPDLATPYDISYQDQLNANQADFNATQRMVGYNPAALAQLNAQKYAANSGVLGEQFRANQAMRMGVYDKNRDTLNQAKLANIGMYDQQYQRQSQAKSNTKAITQAALNSIGDKYAKNKLENRELGIYENLYNYRYDPQGRAINMNAPWQPNVPNVYSKGDQTANMRAVYDQQGKFLRWEPIEQTKTTTEETTTAIPPAATNPTVAQKKYGGSTKAKNGSIVSAYKNL